MGVPEQTSITGEKPVSRRKARRKVFELLFEFFQRPGADIHDLLHRTFEEHVFGPEDEDEGLVVGDIAGTNREFVENIALLVAERYELIDHMLETYPHEWKFERMGMPEQVILRMALCELLFTDTPFKIVINEALDLAKIYGEVESNRFLNGILGSIMRDIDQLKEDYGIAP